VALLRCFCFYLSTFTSSTSSAHCLCLRPHGTPSPGFRGWSFVPLPLVLSLLPSTAVFAVGAMSFETGTYQNAVAMLNPAGAPHPLPGDATFPVRVRPGEAVFLMKLTDSCDIPNALVVQV